MHKIFTKTYTMKTNQIMIRDDKRFLQRTKDSYFNATNLLKDWNSVNVNNTKLMSVYNKLKSTNEFVKQLEHEGINKPLISSTKGTWMHPKLFIDFAMWVSIEFKSIVIDYVLDGLIFNRNEAGDYNLQMNAMILEVYTEYYKKKPTPLIYIQEANMIKSLVTNKKRNEMSKQELKQITYLQKVNANLIKKRIGKQARIKRLIEASEITI